MSEFNDVSTEIVDTTVVDIPEKSDWDDFDTGEINDISVEIAEDSEALDQSNQFFDFETDEEAIRSDADKAADYARSFGFDKAADYIVRHYDGGEFVPGDPIPITTRNMALEGMKSANGVLFERRTAELTDGLSVEGVFPDFESIHHVELGEAANDMSLYQQFSACRADFQDHMYDSPEKLQGLTLGAMERMDSPQGYTPEGYTWQHNPETGSFDLVSQDDHSVGHTGGNALWGI